MEGGPPSSCLQRGAPCHGIIGIMVNPPLGEYIVSIWGTHGFLWGLVVGDGSELTNQSDDHRVHGSTEDEMEQNYFVASVPTVYTG